MSSIISRYEEYLIQVKHASANTVSSYMRDIRQFVDWLERVVKTGILNASQQNISNYLDYLLEVACDLA